VGVLLISVKTFSGIPNYVNNVFCRLSREAGLVQGQVALGITVSSLHATTSLSCMVNVCAGTHFVAALPPDDIGALGWLAPNHWIVVARLTACPRNDFRPLTVCVTRIAIPWASVITRDINAASSPRP